jgi:uncharacterized protein YciI
MNRRTVLKTLGVTIMSATAATAEAQAGPPTQLVVFHLPGPNWKKGEPLSAQQGVREHVEHYRKLLQAGKLAMGGPFLDDAGGGMMIAMPGVDRAELTAFAMADPVVSNGLLTVQVRTWMVGMRQSP